MILSHYSDPAFDLTFCALTIVKMIVPKRKKNLFKTNTQEKTLTTIKKLWFKVKPQTRTLNQSKAEHKILAEGKAQSRILV